MCAIFGIIGEYDALLARKGLASMHHRGPDYCGIVEKRGLFFAHNRLSIMNLNTHAHQPMRHEKVLLSFNGEIYNFNTLRQELPFDFKTTSETEVLIAAYLHWGLEFVHRLVGMFAIAILDGDTLYLFRDRLGKKPLFYLQNGQQFIFASEIKALKPFLKSKRMSTDALLSYLSFLAPTPPHTFFEGIYKLESGQYLRHQKGETRRYTYYSILNTPAKQIQNTTEAHERIDSAFSDALQLRLQADVPMASLLSGGIDSALIAAVAQKHKVDLSTFTLGYNEYSNYDERQNAAETAQALGIKNYAIEIDKRTFIEASEQVFTSMDEPLNDPAAVPLYLLFEAIKKQGFKVVLSGEGSDELFLGYRQYFEYLDIEKAATLHHKNWLKKYFRSNFSMNREWEWYKRVFDSTLLFRTSGEKFTDLQKNALMRRNIRDNESLTYLQPYRDAFKESAHTDESIWYSFIDLKLFQAEHFLSKLDRVSMAHSIESRTPFLDHRLVETVFSISPELRYKEGITKALLKPVAANYLPLATIGRKKKGFSNPYMEWLNASGKLSLIDTVNKQTGLFNDAVLHRYVNMAKKGRFKQHVWGLYVLSHWIDKELL